MNEWYDSLKKSPLTPPSGVFGPVWSVLYLLMVLSLLVYIRTSPSPKGLALFFIQLFFNVTWSILFFREKVVCVSLLNIIFMNIFVFLAIIEFGKTSKVAARLLWPYMVWILFAMYLNYYICVNNKATL